MALGGASGAIRSDALDWLQRPVVTERGGGPFASDCSQRIKG